MSTRDGAKEENMLSAMRSRGDYTKADVEALCAIAVAAALKGLNCKRSGVSARALNLVGALYDLQPFENSLYASAMTLGAAEGQTGYCLAQTAERHNQNGPCDA